VAFAVSAFEMLDDGQQQQQKLNWLEKMEKLLLAIKFPIKKATN